MKAFVIAENDVAARELCVAARSIADSVVLCIVGTPAITGIADVCVHIDVPASNVLDDAYLSVENAYNAAAANCILAENALRSLSLVGRLCAALDTAAIAGVNELDGDTATSVYFGGAGVRVAKAEKIPAYIINRGVFDGAKATGTDAVEEIEFQAPAKAIVKKGEEALSKSDVNLAAADVVVACGRGFSEEADLQLAYDLASKVGGEVGCTRPLAEGVNWFPKEAYIGVTGAVVKPRVFISCGISGQMQHMVGANGSDVIVAINKDKNAPIFKQCDYGLIGELKDVLPALNAAL